MLIWGCRMTDLGLRCPLGIASVFRQFCVQGAMAICFVSGATADVDKSDWEIFVDYSPVSIENCSLFEIGFEDISLSQREIDAELGKMSRSGILILGSDGSVIHPTREEFAEILADRRLELERPHVYRVDRYQNIRDIDQRKRLGYRSCSLETIQDGLLDQDASKWFDQWSGEPQTANAYSQKNLSWDAAIAKGRFDSLKLHVDQSVQLEDARSP